MPFDRFHGSQKHCGWETILFRNDVQHPMHAVGEVDIGMAGWAPHRAVAVCKTGAGVAPVVFGADVGLGFGDQTSNALISLEFDEALSEQLPRDRKRGAIEEVAWDYRIGCHHCNLVNRILAAVSGD